MKMFQLIIQYERFKKTSFTQKRVTTNTIEWFNIDPDLILTIYKLINQGVDTFNDQYYNTHTNRFYPISLQKVISTTITVTDHV